MMDDESATLRESYACFQKGVENRIITTYRILRLLVRSGFLDTYQFDQALTRRENPAAFCFATRIYFSLRR